MNVSIIEQIEKDFKCHVIQKYGNLKGNLEHEVNIALQWYIHCEEKGFCLNELEKIKEYCDEC